MADFCTCGSLIVNGSCTRKGCVNRISYNVAATYRQIELIKSLKVQLGEDPEEFEFTEKLKNMTTRDAATLIEDLLTRKELGGD
jgi:hypothetical protein